MNFDDLGLSPKVLAAVKFAGYSVPTPIQLRAIPAALAGRDVLGIAQTGTGKTGAFVIPLLDRMEKGRARARMPRVLIIEPTRELAAQVVNSLTLLNSEHKLTTALLIGGVAFEEQSRNLDRGSDVLIATPGRLLDHFERGRLLLNGIELLVIDEADRLLDMGFVPDIEQICKRLPATRQTLFFSATMPPEIQLLVSTFLHNPERIEISPPSSTATTVEQSVIAVPDEPAAKRQILRNLIRDAKDLKNAIIFCNRKRDVASLFRSLQRHGFNVHSLHGDMDQHARTETLDLFRSSDKALLVASDIAARGLDINDVSHVFNFDVPTHAEDYVHRIGRTGRAGRVGIAVTLVAPCEHKYLNALQNIIKSKLSWQERAAGVVENTVVSSRSSHRGGSSRRPNRSRKDRTENSLPPDDKSVGQVNQTMPDTCSKPPRRSGSDKPPVVERDYPDMNRVNLRGLHLPSPREPFGDRSPQVGLGDHIPAFLLQPCRPSQK